MQNTTAEIQLVNHTFSNDEDSDNQQEKINKFKNIFKDNNFNKYYPKEIELSHQKEIQEQDTTKLQQLYQYICNKLNLFQNNQDMINTVKVKQYFNQISFNIRDFDQLTNQHSLSILILIFVDYYNLYTKMRINKQKLLQFIIQLEENYNGTLYHNRIHVADCVQMSFVLIESLQKEILDQFTDCDRLVIILGAACHDFNHTGIDTGFLQYENQCLQKLYPRRGQLERIHAIKSWQLILKYNFLPMIYLQEFKVRFTEIILATDMMVHKKYIEGMKQIQDDYFINISKQSLQKIQLYKWMVIKIVIKLSDISNTIRNFEQSKQWAYSYVNEQRNIGLQKIKFDETIALNDLQDPQNYQKDSISKSQINFITYVMKPFVQQIVRLKIFTIDQNLQNWQNY